MKKHWLADGDSKLELSPERIELSLTRREIPEVIQAAFADCNNLRSSCQLREIGKSLAIEVRCMVRMNARGATITIRVFFNELDRGASARDRTACNQQVLHTDVRCPSNHCVSIGIEAVMGEIDSDIDEGGPRCQ
jgi:hypothetical protein